MRIPASVNGLVGVKPSRGRVSNAPFGAEVTGLGTNGPLARTVRDAAALLDAMAGPVPGDPYWAPPLPDGRRWASGSAGSVLVSRHRIKSGPDLRVSVAPRGSGGGDRAGRVRRRRRTTWPWP